jgi:hypothetical protein
MDTSKNSRSRPAASDAKPPQAPYAPTHELPFCTAGVPPALLQPIISIPASPSPQFLIANPELEFPTTPTKQTIEAKSNRKKIAIFHPGFRLVAGGLPINRYLPLMTRFLIETPRLESLVTPRKHATSQSLIETIRPFPIAESMLPCLPAPSMIIFNSVLI